jgi:hypothetical protein
MGCGCPGKQIRRHLFVANIVVWLAAIAVLAWFYSLV